jgi:purine-binding chemotaxis protein CheW
MGSADSDGASWLLCRVGRCLCALPLASVVETMRPPPIEPIADAPRSVLGLSIVRGTAVPVVDIASLLGDPKPSPQRLVTLNTGTRIVGLVAEAVLGVRSIAPDALATLPPLLKEAAGEVVAAVGTLDDELLFFLHTARLVPEDALATLDGAGAGA